MSSVTPNQELAISSSSTGSELATASTDWVHGHILGVELPVIDIFRAKTFYENVFNWEFFQYNNSNVIHFRSGTISGIVLQVEEYNHYTLAHIHSPAIMIPNTGRTRTARGVAFTIQVRDIDETLIEVRRAGGRLWVQKGMFRDDPPGRDGYFAYILDTEDNVVGLRSIDAVGVESH